jgi:hypothetical protein
MYVLSVLPCLSTEQHAFVMQLLMAHPPLVCHCSVQLVTRRRLLADLAGWDQSDLEPGNKNPSVMDAIKVCVVTMPEA